MQWDNAYEHEPLVSFVARSACALTELFINNIPISQRELEEVLNLMSGSINFLQMEGCFSFRRPPLRKRLLQLLTWRGHNEAFLCPNLESISVDSSFIGKRYGLLTTMVESRWHTGDGRTQMTKVAITILKKDKASLDQLKRLRNEGLSVVVKFGIEETQQRNVEDTDDGDTDDEDTSSGYLENEETGHGEDTEELL